MTAIHGEEFTRDAFRIALTSGLTGRQVASDLGIGLSTLGKWIRAISDEAKGPERDADLLRENEWLRKENRILKDLSRNGKQSGGLFSRRRALPDLSRGRIGREATTRPQAGPWHANPNARGRASQCPLVAGFPLGQFRCRAQVPHPGRDRRQLSRELQNPKALTARSHQV